MIQTDHKPATITTADVRHIALTANATRGKESGKVVKGTTRVVYVCDKVENQ